MLRSTDFIFKFSCEHSIYQNQPIITKWAIFITPAMMPIFSVSTLSVLNLFMEDSIGWLFLSSPSLLHRYVLFFCCINGALHSPTSCGFSNNGYCYRITDPSAVEIAVFNCLRGSPCSLASGDFFTSAGNTLLLPGHHPRPAKPC